MDENEDRVVARCRCGCGEFVFSKWVDRNGKTQEFYFEYWVPNFYAEQIHLWKVIWERIQLAWKMLRGKSYCYAELILNPEEVEEFKKAIAQL